jgi:phosphodiesterase/alkaline phosphatase D-like protein
MLMGLDTPIPGAPKFVDTWDGYAAEREELVSFWLKEGIRDVVVMTGDDHDNYAGIVTTTGHQSGTAGAVEFVVPSVTSDNTSELIGGTDAGGILAETDARAINPHLRYVDQRHHGYCVLEASADALRVDFKHVSSRTDPAAGVSTAARYRVPRGQIELQAV